MSDLRDAARQALEALDLCRDWPGAYDECSQAVTALKAALAEEALQRLSDANQEIEAVLEQKEQTNLWRDAVDDELVSLHMVASDDPRESIRRLIDWHCAVQIDPLVSSAAQELIERGKREAQSEQEPCVKTYSGGKPNYTQRFTLSCGCPSQHGGVPAYWDRDGSTAFGMICEKHWHQYGARSEA